MKGSETFPKWTSLEQFTSESTFKVGAMNLINSQLELTENSYFCFPKLRFESKEIWGFKGTSHEVICFLVYEQRLCKQI